MAENLAYRHIKVTLQTRVDGLGSSGHCHGVDRVSNIGGLRQQKLIHRNTALHCLGWAQEQGDTLHSDNWHTISGHPVTVYPTVHCSLLVVTTAMWQQHQSSAWQPGRV